jgi:hypothetical protein
MSGQCENGSDGREPRHWGVRLIVVNAVPLQVALGHESCLVLDDLTIGASLGLEYPLASDGRATGR